MSLTPTLRERLRSQLEAIVTILAGASPQAPDRRSPTGQWSAHENLAHLARHHEVMLERLRLILNEERPNLPRYRAETDPEWESWRALPLDQILGLLRAQRAEILQLVDTMDDDDLARIGVHPTFGPLSVPEWLEFFLLHEGHHLYMAMLRVRGA
jgi:DinB family protein